MVILELQDQGVIEGLAQFQGRLDKKRDLWDRLQANVIRDWFQALWGSLGFGAWEYTLYDTGALYRSFTRRGDAENISEVIDDQTFRYGSALDYSIFWEQEILQESVDNPRFLSLIESEIENWLQDVIQESF